jgi:hypothetical protein
MAVSEVCGKKKSKIKNPTIPTIPTRSIRSIDQANLSRLFPHQLHPQLLPNPGLRPQ